MVQGSNLGRGDIFLTHPDRPWGLPSLLYNGYRVHFLGVKWLGHGIGHPTPSSSEAKERIKLYIYSPSGPSEPVLGLTFMDEFKFKKSKLTNLIHITDLNLLLSLTRIRDVKKCDAELWRNFSNTV
jgi:hypothetical protein